MVLVICEKTGIEFDAYSRRTKNHPTIMSWLEKANRYDWYGQALDAIKSGREQRFTTIEQYVTLFEETERKAKEDRSAKFNAEYERKQVEDAARRERYVTNSVLRDHQYRWSDLGFPPDEEIDNSYMGPTPRYDWTLFSPDNRVVSVREAMQEIYASSQREYAKEWLEQRDFPLAPDPEPDTYEWKSDDSPERQLECQTHHHAHAWSDVRWLTDYPGPFKSNGELDQASEQGWLEWTRASVFTSYPSPNASDLEKLHVLFVSIYVKHYVERIPAWQESA